MARSLLKRFKRSSWSGSLRGQILIFTFSMILMGTVLVGGALFVISRAVVLQNQISTAESSIRHAAYTVEQDLGDLAEMMDHLFVDKQVLNALEMDVQTLYDQTLQWNQIRGAMTSYERLSCFQYINCIFIYNSEGMAHVFRYMEQDIRSYQQRNEELGWYEAALNEEGRLLWCTDITPNAAAFQPYAQDTGTDVSLIRALRDSNYKNIRGAAYVSVQPRFFSLLQKNNGLDGMDVFLLDNAQRLLGSAGTQEQLPENVLKELEQSAWQDSRFRYCIADGQIFYECLIQPYQYRLIASQPVVQLATLSHELVLFAGLLICVLVVSALALWAFLTRTVIRPVNALADTMKRVHTEGLAVRSPAVGSREFVYLAENLNYMLHQIQVLMETNLEKERAIQEAEHKATLAQINPHFVYNALFAIRMMAIIQKAENIQGMVDALWRMLKNSTSRGKESFTLADEIQNVKDYIHILSATNIQKFQVLYHIEPELMDIRCPKFLIQPVVENAMMHGILPKQGFSTVDIRAYRRGTDLVIEVSNDGLPIPPHQLEQVTLSLQKTATAHKGLGLSSIRRRLQLLFGDAAGLTIESDTAACKTKVTIHYPVNEEENHV